MAAERTRRRLHPKNARKAKALELAIEKRRALVTDLRLEAWSIREIAKKLGCSVGTVHSDLEAVLERTQEHALDAARQEKALSLGRLDLATKALIPKVKRKDLDAIDRLVKVEHRRAKIHGFDAPTRQELSGPAGAPITLDARTALLERLAGLITGAAPGAPAGENPGKADAGGTRDPSV